MNVRPILALAGLAAAIAIACYKPDIPNGKIACSDKGECPDGSNCQSGFCLTGAGGGTAGAGGMTGGGGAGGAGGVCVGPLPACTAQSGGTCDPVCQSGCECSQRCNISGEKIVCQNPVAAADRKQVGDVCDTMPLDSCQPGLICLPEVADVCKNHCYRFCRSDADCTGSAHCSVPLAVNGAQLPQKVCDNPPGSCLPFGNQTTCIKGPGFGCYLMGHDYPEEVVCDCAGSLPEDAECQFERECRPGLICVATTSPNDKPKCRRVCPLGNTALIAELCGLRACSPFSNSTKYGYCNNKPL